VFDGDTGRFLNCNENATRLYGYGREELLTMHPADVSPLFQPDGRLSLDAACNHIQRALNGEAPVFEWMHRHSDGRLIPCEVRLVRLPAEGRNLVRGSVIDNTERKRRERIQQATYQISEAVHAAEDLESLYRLIHETISGLMPAENFYIALFESATGLISFPYHVDERSEHPKPFKLGTGLTSCVIRGAKPLLVTATMAEQKQQVGEAITFNGLEGLTYVEAGTPAAIWLGVPLILRGEPIGVMAVQDYDNEGAYREEEKQILMFVAAQTALAIDRKRTEQALRLRSEQIRRHRNVLLELALLDKSNLDHALTVICTHAAAVSNLARVGYWKLPEDGRALTCEVLYRQDCSGADPKAKGMRLPAAVFPKYFAALARREPIVAHHAETHPDTRDFTDSYLRPLGITSMLDVPVWLHGRLVGVFCQEHVGEPRTWTPEEVDFASSLATMVSLSLEAAQRARSEQALRASEQKFRALFEASGQGVILHDEKQYLELNPAALRILKYSAQALVGKNPVDTSPPVQPDGEATASAAARHIAACLEKGTERFEWTARAATGEPIPLDVILTRVEMGGKWLIQAVIDDISERKKAEAELLRALAHERELSQLKSNFVSMVSHEFRTPLGIILSSAEILEDYLDQLEPDERQHHLRSIARSTKRMSELMEEVLVLGRLDAGRMEFTPAPLDLQTLSRRLVDEVASATDARCPIRLEADATSGQAQADEKLLRHILTNLLSNAVKYSEAGEPVDFALRREETDAVWMVRDHGIGVPEQDREWLFSAFHRGSNVGQRPGTGLGLVIVKRCVELHGGRITLDSAPGQGTTVTVRLPVFPDS
jgi:PAS domain S-box-containing protein